MKQSMNLYQPSLSFNYNNSQTSKKDQILRGKEASKTSSNVMHDGEDYDKTDRLLKQDEEEEE